MLKNFIQIVNCAVSGSFRTDQRTAEAEVFACQNAVLEHALQTAILAIQETDLASADTHITCRNIDVRSDVAIQSCHKGLAETHDLSITLACRIKVGTALAAADRKACQGILEDLLKAEELDDSRIDVRLETKAAFVRSDRSVELAAVADVGVDIAVVIFPDYAESEHTLRLHHTAEKIDFFVFRMLINNRSERRKNFFDCLNEFRLVAVLLFDISDYLIYILAHFRYSSFLVKK